MKKFEFVPRREYSSYLHRSFDLLKKVTDELKKLNIKAEFYPVGSGKHHLVTRIIENGRKQPFDLDFNLDIDTKTLPNNLKDLNLLKETIRTILNKIIAAKSESFQDGQDSTSVITTPLHFNDSKEVEFSFDIAIVSKNRNGDLQRLIRNKKTGNITWSQIRKSNNIDSKIQEIKNKGLWNSVRKTYLELKNNQKITEPSFICRIIAVNTVYDEILSSAHIQKKLPPDIAKMYEKIKKSDLDTKNTIGFKNLEKKVNEEIQINQKKGIENYREKAIKDVYDRSLNYGSKLYNSFCNPYFDPVGDSAEDY